MLILQEGRKRGREGGRIGGGGRKEGGKKEEKVGGKSKATHLLTLLVTEHVT